MWHIRRCVWKSLNQLTMSRILLQMRLFSGKSEPTVCVNRIGAVVTIGINRPSKRNCVDTSTAHLLRKSFKDFENDDSMKVAVLHGIGGNFCAGFDLKELATEGTSALSKQSGDDGPMGPSRMFIKKPVIGAISGYAVAGGFELALFCDLRVVEETAIMGVFCRRFGVPLIDGGTVRLPALIGLSRALDLVLTGRAINAKEAYEMGIANRIVACGTALGQAIQLATSLVKFPEQCLLADRKSCYYSTYLASNQEDAFKYESLSMNKDVQNEAVLGATKFLDGIGKHGKYVSLKDKIEKDS